MNHCKVKYRKSLFFGTFIAIPILFLTYPIYLTVIEVFRYFNGLGLSSFDSWSAVVYMDVSMFILTVLFVRGIASKFVVELNEFRMKKRISIFRNITIPWDEVVAASKFEDGIVILNTQYELSLKQSNYANWNEIVQYIKEKVKPGAFKLEE